MKRRTVNFDSYNSLDDLNIIFATLSLGSPSPKTISVNVPYRDGALDLSDYFGRVSYTNRTITMNFLIPVWVFDQMTVYHNVQKLLNGKQMKITFSSDDEYYYYGRLTVGDFAVSGTRWSFNITADCDPFQYQEITKTQAITTSGTLALTGGIYNSALTITSSASCTITLGTTTKSISASTQTVTLPLEEGTNSITVTGTTNLTVDYTIGRI